MRVSCQMIAWALGLPSCAALAHHSFVSEYDGTKPMIKKGVISRISWVNPHSYVYIQVTDEAGNVEEWALEGFPVAALRRQGFGRSDVREGDVLSAVGWPARNGSSRLQAYELTMEDGRKLILGPRSGELPPGYEDPAARATEDARERGAGQARAPR